MTLRPFQRHAGESRLLSVVLVTLSVFAVTNSPAVAATLLPPGYGSWEYTFADPTSDPTWNTTTGVGGIWSSGPAPFGNAFDGDFGYHYGTFWQEYPAATGHLWVRTSIDATNWDPSTVTWDLGVDNGFTMYLNGTEVSERYEGGYTWRWEYSGYFVPNSPVWTPELNLLQPGRNVLALALVDDGVSTAFDMQITGTSLPEPSTLVLLGTGTVSGLLARIWRWRKRTV
jgi:hypothetical protein